MKKIMFLLEYKCLPIWVYNKENELLCVELPDDMKDNVELDGLIKEIAEEYDSLFINNSVEFSFKGFASEEDEKRFDQKVHMAIDLLMREAKGKYDVVVEGCYKKYYN